MLRYCYAMQLLIKQSKKIKFIIKLIHYKKFPENPI